ncbi:hypothetical protein IFM89_009941 [Coptis chinensis]|uniref:Uncharacterized protein n=1 Tax=Coptis chinensis TaxID=261450 RepID=A0A835HLI0_9MAGN|nr:hypothetical protein IFM89_009941 [Coptis chinensis]
MFTPLHYVHYKSAIEMVEAELRDSSSTMNLSQPENASSDLFMGPLTDCLLKQETNIVRVVHMTLTLSRTFKSTIVDTIQSLPQHQQVGFVCELLIHLSLQIVLCSMVKLFRGTKKDTTVGEGIFKMGQSRDDRSKRVTLKVDESDIMFALQSDAHAVRRTPISNSNKTRPTDCEVWSTHGYSGGFTVLWFGSGDRWQEMTFTTYLDGFVLDWDRELASWMRKLGFYGGLEVLSVGGANDIVWRGWLVDWWRWERVAAIVGVGWLLVGREDGGGLSRSRSNSLAGRDGGVQVAQIHTLILGLNPVGPVDMKA